MLNPSKSESLKKDKFFFFGLLAATFAASLVVLNQKIYTTPLIVAASAFAVAIPSLALVVSAIYFEEVSESYVQHAGLDIASAVGIFCVYVGFVSLFWHISFIVGVIAIFSLLISTVFLMRVNKLVADVRRK